MKIIDLRHKNRNTSLQQIRQALSDANIEVIEVEPSALSFITSMRIAAVAKHQRDSLTAVVVDSYRDAVAACSISSIGYPLPIIYCVPCDNRQQVPTGVAAELARKVNCWCFDSEQALEAYSRIPSLTMKSTRVLPRPAVPEIINSPISRHEPTTPLHLAWMGEITDAQTLEHAIHAIAAMPAGSWRFDIYGTGTAGRVMPAIKAAQRYADVDINWVGENYEWQNVFASADIMVQKSWAVSADEAAAMAHGIPVIDPGLNQAQATEILSQCISDSKLLPTLSAEAIERYQSKHSMSFHVEQWRELLASLFTNQQ